MLLMPQTLQIVPQLTLNTLLLSLAPTQALVASDQYAPDVDLFTSVVSDLPQSEAPVVACSLQDDIGVNSVQVDTYKVPTDITQSEDTIVAFSFRDTPEIHVASPKSP
ncbi:unnamed protein product [Cuscuta epithymum]|uniref:Secreted protein n=1 Tax=Cuscuta epithymum TaxID=186058 RepID=A0AAV0GJZ8_9ASTE|nr:unnamed protein product [Cuscuta epithymum]